MNAATSQYAVALTGHEFDLADLRRIFAPSSDVVVTEINVSEGKITALLADEFAGMASGPEIAEAAERIIGKLNGVLFAADPDRSVVAMGPVYKRKQGGTWSLGTIYAAGNLEVGSARMRSDAMVTDNYGNPVPGAPAVQRQAKWFALTSSGTPDGDRALDILNAFRRNPDWYDLWSAFELYMSDEASLTGWQTDEVELFRKTATLHRHGKSSKHGKKALTWFATTGKKPMDLKVAQRLVSTHAALWLDWKTP